MYVHAYLHVLYLIVVFCLVFSVAATAFYKEEPVIDFMKEVLSREREFDIRRPLKDFVRRKFAKEIKGQYYNHMKYCLLNTVHVALFSCTHTKVNALHCSYFTKQHTCMNSYMSALTLKVF